MWWWKRNEKKKKMKNRYGKSERERDRKRNIR